MHRVRQLTGSSALSSTRHSRVGVSTVASHPGQPSWTRSLHMPKPLPYDVRDGLGKFYSADSLHQIAVVYQRGLLEQLNEEVKKTRWYKKSVVQTVIESASERQHGLVFTYASRALNNSFFLEFLKPLPEGVNNHEDEMTIHFGNALRTHYGEVKNLKSVMGAALLGMTSGYVWLVTDRAGHLAVMPTFGSGTFLVRSRQQRHPFGNQDGRTLIVGEYDPRLKPDLQKDPKARLYDGIEEQAGNEAAPMEPADAASGHAATSNQAFSTPASAPSSPTSGLSHPVPPMNPSTPSRKLTTSAILHQSQYPKNSANAPTNDIFSQSPSSSFPSTASYLSGYNDGAEHGSSLGEAARLGENLFPLFCLSAHEHAWMSGGYGMWGQEEYVRRFFTVLDWGKVSQAFAKFVPDRTGI